ncbi:hypothetical protein [Streptomyces sp. HM190]|uniref:hypothetical protein n=1 Tax=Streptomyces sp. HM190 TaxID=2695266 RepID=UPI001359F5AE|nr:hypothetical protein [Streptomyces sp. HM190]
MLAMSEMRETEAFPAVVEEPRFGRATDRLRLSTSRVGNLVRTVKRRRERASSHVGCDRGGHWTAHDAP